MKKLINYIFKGICLGNILAIISYLIIYFLSGNEGLKFTLDNLSIEYNYIRMIIYSSLGGVLLYLVYGYCLEFIIKEKNDKDDRRKYIIIGGSVVIVIVYTIILQLGVLRFIYDEENFNRIYYINIIATATYLFGKSLFYTILKSEIDWINSNLIKR